VWKTIRKHNTHHRPIPPLKGETSFEGKCKVLREAPFPDKSEQNSEIPPNFVTPLDDLSNDFVYVTPREIYWTLGRLKTDTAVGPDRISYSTVRQLHNSSPQTLPLLFTAMLRFGAHPFEWATANCVVIPKSGKANYKSPSSYHPISLLSCFGKVFESIMCKRIENAALRRGAISRSQLGGIQQNSAIDALIVLTTPMSLGLRRPLKGRKTKTRPKPTLATLILKERSITQTLKS
jgi:hypothetical protein